MAKGIKKPKVEQCCDNCTKYRQPAFKFLTKVCDDDRVKFRNTRPEFYCVFHVLKTNNKNHEDKSKRN